jgi:hypothetical protein
VARKTPDESRTAPPIVRVAPLVELRVFQISEAELEKLANGPPGQVHLSFALASLPAALTVFITLQTVDIVSTRIYTIYWIAFLLLALEGARSLLLWRTSGSGLSTLIQEIRDRMPERPGIPEQITEAIPRGDSDLHRD